MLVLGLDFVLVCLFRFSIFGVRSDHLIPVLLASVVLGFSFFSTRSRDWLERTFPKCLVLCCKGCKTLISQEICILVMGTGVSGFA